MSIITLLSTLLPLIGKLIDILTKTPEEKIIDVKESLIKYMSDLQDGIKHLEEHPGDTSLIDDALNKRRS